MSVIACDRNSDSIHAQWPGLKDLSKQDVVAANRELDIRKNISILNIDAGTRLYFRLKVANKGSEPANNVVIDSPIPSRTTYVPGSVGGGRAEIFFSMDGGENFDKVGLGDGEISTAGRYSDVRWVIQAIQPGRMVEMYFQAIVDSYNGC